MKRVLATAAVAMLTVVLLKVMLMLPPAEVDLRHAVAQNMATTGVDHPVTAVLLNFRGYDTLLEVAVLLTALFVILAMGGAAPPDHRAQADNPQVTAMARRLAPLMVMVGGYLLWAGAFRPGGAFQAGAVLAAALVLLHLAGLLPPWQAPGKALRAGFALGFAVFLIIAVALGGQGAFLQYPPAQAGLLIVIIEATLTFSLGFLLAGLFLFLTRRGDE